MPRRCVILKRTVKPKILKRQELPPKGVDVFPKLIRQRLRQPPLEIIKYKYMCAFIWLRRLYWFLVADNLKERLLWRIRSIKFPQIKRKTDNSLVFAVSFLICVITFALSASIETGRGSTSFLETIPGTVTGFSDHIFLKIDEGSLFFILVVSLVGIGAQIYSLSYMLNDFRQIKFSFLLFCFTVLIVCLVVSDNFWFFFVIWELIGLVSFFLINFWSSRVESNLSGEKAMVANRVCDLTLFVCFTLFTINGADGFSCLLTNTSDAHLLWIVLLVLASTAKSAQWGFHGWLLNAMEGPTPVSALMHAATLVTAGAILLIKSLALLGNFGGLVVLIGVLTSFCCGLAACFENDLKAIIAYSTAGQLGFVFILIGCLQPELALMHLSNHAIFKSLLFFAAGLIIHTFHTQYALARTINHTVPVAAVALIISASCLIGAPFSSGFFSKEYIVFTPLSLSSGIRAYSTVFLPAIQLISLIYNIRMVWLLLSTDLKNRVIGAFVEKIAYVYMQTIIVAFSAIALFLGWFLNIKTAVMYQTVSVLSSKMPGATVLSSSGSALAWIAVFLVLLFVFWFFTGANTSVDVLGPREQFEFWKKNARRVIFSLFYSLLVTWAVGSNKIQNDAYKTTVIYLPLHVIILERIRWLTNYIVDFIWRRFPIFRFLRLLADIWFLFFQIWFRFIVLVPIYFIMERFIEYARYYLSLFSTRFLSWSSLKWFEEPIAPLGYEWWYDFEFVYGAAPFWKLFFKNIWERISALFVETDRIAVIVDSSNEVLNEDFLCLEGRLAWTERIRRLKVPKLKGRRRRLVFYFTSLAKWICSWKKFKGKKYRKVRYLIYLAVCFSTITAEKFEFGLNSEIVELYFWHIAFWILCFWIHVYSKRWVSRVRRNRKAWKFSCKRLIWEI